jgi:hypothetical protein
MISHVLERYGLLFQATFREVDGAVIAVVPGLEPQDWGRSLDCPVNRARYENEESHQHFHFRIGGTVWERWRNNLILACSVRDFWRLRLRDEFPDREFVLSVVSELAVVFEPEPGRDAIEIVPELRMWSGRNDPDGEMAEAFSVNKVTLDQIDVRRDQRPMFVPQDAVFTRKHTVRKDFLRKLAGSESEFGGMILF